MVVLCRAEYPPGHPATQSLCQRLTVSIRQFLSSVQSAPSIPTPRKTAAASTVLTDRIPIVASVSESSLEVVC